MGINFKRRTGINVSKQQKQIRETENLHEERCKWLHRIPGRKNILGAIECGKVKSCSELEEICTKNVGLSGS